MSEENQITGYVCGQIQSVSCKVTIAMVLQNLHSSRKKFEILKYVFKVCKIINSGNFLRKFLFSNVLNRS